MHSHLLYQGCLKVHQLITILVDGNGYNRTAMMMSYDAGAGWWTFIISTPSNILGTTDGRNLTVQF
jgi:hypothetical protein